MTSGRGAAAGNETVVATYDRLATAYDVLFAPMEAGTRAVALDLLALDAGERVLEVGCGPGRALTAMAARVGPSGRVVGVDAAPGMLARARRHAERAAATDRVGLVRGDARSIPVRDDAVTAAFVEDALELFSPGEARAVLDEIGRALAPDGRLCVVTMERAGAGRDPFVRAYDWVYDHVPGYDRVGCRPVRARRWLETAGYRIARVEHRRRWGIWPTEILLARPA